MDFYGILRTTGVVVKFLLIFLTCVMSPKILQVMFKCKDLFNDKGLDKVRGYSLLIFLDILVFFGDDLIW